MKRILVLIVITAMALGGCATMNKADRYSYEQQKKLALAKILLQSNRPAAARKTLAEISTAPPVASVTDEALFRLALLDLETDSQKTATEKSEKSLTALLTSFSSSSWSSHAIMLKNLLEAYDSTVQEKAELEKTIKNLKNSNTSLSKENANLRQDLEKLKKLDLELEMKKKR